MKAFRDEKEKEFLDKYHINSFSEYLVEISKVLHNEDMIQILKLAQIPKMSISKIRDNSNITYALVWQYCNFLANLNLVSLERRQNAKNKIIDVGINKKEINLIPKNMVFCIRRILKNENF